MPLNIPPFPPYQPQWADFQVWWQLAKQAIESANSDLSDQINAIEAAQASATAAQASADAVRTSDKITASSIIPAEVLTASDAGTDATITIASHVRLYGDATQLSVTGGSITNLAYATDYGVYYDDPSCSVTEPAYQATSILAGALNNSVLGRHMVGIVSTPASGGAATSGGSSPPGTDSSFRNRFDTVP